MWSIRSILTGLISFMNSEEITTGGVGATNAQRIQLAKESLDYCLKHDALASELFKDELEIIVKEREEAGDGDHNTWPPKRKVVEKVIPKVDETPARRRRMRNATRLNSRKTTQQDGTNADAAETTEEKEGQEDDSKGSRHDNGTNAGAGKNAARNKKKKEKEKRKKLVKKFATNLSEQVPKFLDAVQDRLLEYDLDVSQYQPDHVCWRTEALEEYSELVSALQSSDDWTLLVESEVGGRSIATFQMKQGITIQCDGGNFVIDVVEIPSPKDGSPYRKGLEHVEYVISTDEDKPSSPRNDETHERTLNNFMAKFPNVEWSTQAKDKEINPDVSTKFDDLPDFDGSFAAKFHLVPLAEVIKYEIDNNVV